MIPEVLYDISVLGEGHVNPAARTGVFRVIENLALELVKRKDCDISFCASLDLGASINAFNYLENSKSLTDIPFLKPSYFSRRKNIFHRKKEYINNLIQNEKAGLAKKTLLKIRIKNLLMQEKTISLINNKKDFLNSNHANIFHSPYHPIPEVFRKLKAVFLTCYDLIPILFPQYTQDGTRNMINKVLNSITTETWVLCISEATRIDLLNYLGSKVDPDKVIVTELAASDIFYQSTDKEENKSIRNLYGIPDAPYILSLCTLEPRKNIDQVIKAFVKLVQEQNIQDLNLVLVGTKGWKFEKIFSEIDANPEIKERVIVTGYVPDEYLALIYSDALMFVYPSFYEGFGLPPLEAMKCGTPVITSNTSSLPEVVGDAGIKISPTDLDAMCQAMLTIYGDETLRCQMRSKSLERSKLFSWQKCAAQTVNAYKLSLK